MSELETKELEVQENEIVAESAETEAKKETLEEREARRELIKEQLEVDEKRKKKKILFIICSIIAVIVLLSVAIRFTMYVHIPDVQNMNYKDAEKLLQSKGLKTDSYVATVNNSLDSELVVEIYPDNEEWVKRSSLIMVGYNLQVDNYIMPDFTNFTRYEIDLLMKELPGIHTNFIKEEHRTDVGQGHMVSQMPAPGTEISVDTHYEFVVSLGSVPAPDVTGLTVSNAEKTLKDSNCKIEIHTVESSKKSGTVVSQSVESGKPLGADVTMVLDVAK